VIEAVGFGLERLMAQRLRPFWTALLGMHSVGRCGMCSAVLCGSSMCRWPECHSRVSGPYQLLALNVLGARDVENGAPFDLWETFGKFSEGLLSSL
jgi:hypothetical protein